MSAPHDHKLVPRPFVFGAAVTGESHVQLNTPCQDACAYEVFGSSAAFAVADGLGSAKESDLGANIAVKAAVLEAGKLLAAPDAKPEEVAKALVLASRAELEKAAAAKSIPLSDLACTLIAGVIRGDTATVAHIGDGAVVIKTGEGLKVLSRPGDSEYVNEGVPLTSREFARHLRVSGPVAGVLCLAAFTDGCQRASLVRSADGLVPHEKFFAPIFDYALAEVADLSRAEAEIKALLASEKMGRVSDDDKTLVIAVLSGEAPK